jgi:hypothetical protein
MRISKHGFALALALVVGLLAGAGISSWGAGTRTAPATGPDGIFKNFAPVVIQTLQKKGMTGDCPMCKKNAWVVHEVPISLPVYETNGKVTFPGTSMPAAAMICKNCGFMSFHSLGALGLVDKTKQQPPESRP